MSLPASSFELKANYKGDVMEAPNTEPRSRACAACGSSYFLRSQPKGATSSVSAPEASL